MKRPVALLSLSGALAIGAVLSSCATFNRNDVAARAGHNELSQRAAQQLIKDADPAQTGAQMRAQLTAWIRLAAVADSKGLTIDGYQHQAQSTYEQGVAGGAPLCLAAIRVTTMADTEPVMAAIQGGMSFADAVTKYSLDASTSAGGAVTDAQGNECLPQASFSPEVIDALKGTGVGVAVAHDFGTFAAVLMMRPFNDLSQEARTGLAMSGFTELELAQALKDSGIWVDSRYGAWNPLSQSVEPLRS